MALNFGSALAHEVVAWNLLLSVSQFEISWQQTSPKTSQNFHFLTNYVMINALHDIFLRLNCSPWSHHHENVLIWSPCLLVLEISWQQNTYIIIGCSFTKYASLFNLCKRQNNYNTKFSHSNLWLSNKPGDYDGIRPTLPALTNSFTGL